MKGVRPEALLIALSLRQPDRAPVEDVRTAAAGVRDWAALVELARGHRAVGYLLQAARRAGLELPADIVGSLEAILLGQAAKALLVDSELASIAATLDRADISAVVLKGPGLARTLYPDTSLRPYDDLDLLVEARAEETTAQVLAARGYAEDRAEWRENRVGQEDRTVVCFHRMFGSADGRTRVELHLDSLQLGIAPRYERERHHRARSVPGVPGMLMFAPEDQLLQLCVHAHKHGFNRLIWLKDLDLLIRGARLDWGQITHDARGEGVTASLWYALELAGEILGTPLPAEVVSLRPGRLTRLLYRAVWPPEVIADLRAYPRRRAVQIHTAESLRGTLPSVVFMGRRADRMRVIGRLSSNALWFALRGQPERLSP